MTNIVVDVESNGPIIGRHSCIAIGAVRLTSQGVEEQGFHGLLRPVSNEYDPSALSVSGFTHEECLEFPDPQETMIKFDEWLSEREAPYILWSDNNGYDASWVNWYFHTYLGRNPFGWSSRRIGDLYCGHNGSLNAGWKHLRTTKHTHNPEDDARGNGEALYKILTGGKFKVKW